MSKPAKKCCASLLAVAVVALARQAHAAPQIKNISLRGLQVGAVNTLVIEGDELTPSPRILLTAPVARQVIKDGATANRLEIELALDSQIQSGIYLLRVASASGISPAVALAIDGLSQASFAEQLPGRNVAMTGNISGSTIAATTFQGKKDEPIVIEVESRRLGAALNPVVHLYDARGTQVASAQGRAALAGDARLSAVLPADGSYRIELHDGLYRGESPGFFRLKVGQFSYADLVYPLAAKRGATSQFEFASTNFPAEARASNTWPSGDPLQRVEPAPWPSGGVNLITGSRPAVRVSDVAEAIEAPAGEKPQELGAAPIAINGRIGKPREQDRFRISVTPGQTLRFDVLASRAGSSLDGVLSIQNEQGAELATSDDRPGARDPLADFKVPDQVTALVAVVRDLEGRGGADYVYRLAITPAGPPSFELALFDDRYQVPKDGAQLVRVRATRAGYNGPIKLNFRRLPASVSITGDEIPAGATDALVTLSAPGLNVAQSLSDVLGTSIDANPPINAQALMPANVVNTHQPWLRDEIALAVTDPAPIGLVWDLFPSDVKLALGTPLPIKLRVTRGKNVSGAVKLTLLNSQIMPRKRVKVNNQDREVDDVDRALRLQSEMMIAADQSEATGAILIPADLPQIAYDLAIQAELLEASGKNTVATIVTPARRMTASTPIRVELASADPIEVRSGLGETGKLVGKVSRAPGFNLPVTLTIAGLTKGLSAPTFNVPADQTQFEFALALPFGAPAGEVKGAKLVATSTVDPKNPKAVVRADEVALALKVVPGEKPAVNKPLAIFEDQPEFAATLNEGGGQISLVSDQKYSGVASLKVTPDQRYNPALPGLGVKIRERPQPGEFRYLRFAWKKQGGQAICLQLNHDGQWGPAAEGKGKFRYHAGPGGECYGGSLALDGNLPAEFTVVTRDLFADFGEFTLTGLALSPVDGEFALFDHIYLGAAIEELDSVKP
ncbi:MAG TPA: hypothetical protein VL175_07325 [Pirellulales bacterium]|jgi:hypothetical protein|nr:hypothetical protein [Pirellulales bacterium]